MIRIFRRKIFLFSFLRYTDFYAETKKIDSENLNSQETIPLANILYINLIAKKHSKDVSKLFGSVCSSEKFSE